MRILAIEPYFGGSHKAFIEGWAKRSTHSWELLTLPPNKWKWRMRHSAVTLSTRAREQTAAGERWDLLFCSDMLNLAEFLGLSPDGVRRLPSVAYFHENQLTYPVIHEKEYDYHFAFSNMNTALAADRVWFNSAFHRNSFLDALHEFLGRMPDYQPMEAVQRIREKSEVRYPGIEPPAVRGERKPGPMRILWAARWEHDKDPEAFFRAVQIIEEEGVDFRLSVIGGGNARASMPIFEKERKRLAHRIDHWGYLETREEYLAALAGADVVVSTAQHEFFGIGVVEAVAAGAYPIVPGRLAYPEIFGQNSSFLYDGDDRSLARRLSELAGQVQAGDLWDGSPDQGRKIVEKFSWDSVVSQWDSELEKEALALPSRF